MPCLANSRILAFAGLSVNELGRGTTQRFKQAAVALSGLKAIVGDGKATTLILGDSLCKNDWLSDSSITSNIRRNIVGTNFDCLIVSLDSGDVSSVARACEESRSADRIAFAVVLAKLAKAASGSGRNQLRCN